MTMEDEKWLRDCVVREPNAITRVYGMLLETIDALRAENKQLRHDFLDVHDIPVTESYWECPNCGRMQTGTAISDGLDGRCRECAL